jgi:hypothetical protein
MSDNNDTDRPAHSAPDPVEEAPDENRDEEVPDENRDAAKSAADQTRKAAEEAFEHIKAARARAAKRVD